VADALFKILELQNLMKGGTRITLLPQDNALIKQFIASETAVETLYGGDGQSG
jgi:hypothetical protein